MKAGVCGKYSRSRSGFSNLVPTIASWITAITVIGLLGRCLQLVASGRFYLEDFDGSQRFLGAISKASPFELVSLHSLMYSTWTGVHRFILRLSVDLSGASSMADKIVAAQSVAVVAYVAGACLFGLATARASGRCVGCIATLSILSIPILWDTTLSAMTEPWATLLYGLSIYFWTRSIQCRSFAMLLLCGVMLALLNTIRTESIAVAFLMWILTWRVFPFWKWFLFGLIAAAAFQLRFAGIVTAYLDGDANLIASVGSNYDFGNHLTIWLKSIRWVGLFVAPAVGVLAIVSVIWLIWFRRIVDDHPTNSDTFTHPRPQMWWRLLCLACGLIGFQWLLIALDLLPAFQRYMVFPALLLTVGVASSIGRVVESPMLRRTTGSWILLAAVASSAATTVVMVSDVFNSRHRMSGNAKQLLLWMDENNVDSNDLVQDYGTVGPQLTIYGMDAGRPLHNWIYCFQPVKQDIPKSPELRGAKARGDRIAANLHNYLANGYGEYVVIVPYNLYLKRGGVQRTFMGHHQRHSYLWPYLHPVQGESKTWELRSPWLDRDADTVVLRTVAEVGRLEVLEIHLTESPSNELHAAGAIDVLKPSPWAGDGYLNEGRLPRNIGVGMYLDPDDATKMIQVISQPSDGSSLYRRLGRRRVRMGDKAVGRMTVSSSTPTVATVHIARHGPSPWDATAVQVNIGPQPTTINLSHVFREYHNDLRIQLTIMEGKPAKLTIHDASIDLTSPSP